MNKTFRTRALLRGIMAPSSAYVSEAVDTTTLFESMSDPITMEDHPEVFAVLPYLPEARRERIVQGGLQVALEEFWDLHDTITCLRSSVSQVGGVNQTLALECDKLMPGFLTDQYPVKTFSQSPSRTNLAYTVENFDVKTAAIIGAIIAAILGMAKLMFGDGSSSSSSDGGGGASTKVEKKIEAVVEDAKKKGEEIAASGVTPAMVTNGGNGNHYTAKDASPALQSRIDELNGRIDEGVTEMQAMAMKIEGPGKVAADKFWAVMGAGNFTEAVVGIGKRYETLSDVLAGSVPKDEAPTLEQVLHVKTAIIDAATALRALGIFEHTSINLELLRASLDTPNAQAILDFFATDPAKVWLAEFDRLKTSKSSMHYKDLLTKFTERESWGGTRFIWSDLAELEKQSDTRIASATIFGNNISGALIVVQDMFKHAHQGNQTEELVSSEAAKAERAFMMAVKMADYMIRLLKNLYHVYNELTVCAEGMKNMVSKDLLTIVDINKHNDKAP